MSSPKAFVRCVKMKDMRAIAAAGRHAWGADKKAAARRRPDATYRSLVYTPGDGQFHKLEPAPKAEGEGEGEPEVPEQDEHLTAWERDTREQEAHLRRVLRVAQSEPEDPEEDPEPLVLDPLIDYPQLFRDFKSRTGAGERGKTTLGLHLLVGVTPAWIDGDPHDPDSEAVRQLVRVAAEWVEAEFGEQPWAVRYDVDERGSGIVDVLVSPTSVYRNGRGAARPWISTNKALEALRGRHGSDKSYQALQTGWATYAKEHLDPDFERGKPGGGHRSPEAFGAALDEERARLAKEREDVEQQRETVEQDRKASAEAVAVAGDAFDAAEEMRQEAVQREERAAADREAADDARADVDAALDAAEELRQEAAQREKGAAADRKAAESARADVDAALQAAEERRQEAARREERAAADRKASATAEAKAKEHRDEATKSRTAATAARERAEREHAAVDAAREDFAEEQAASIAIAEGWLIAAVGKRGAAS